MQKTEIEWSDKTWNPVSGCTKISEGCKFCYAEEMAERFRGQKGFPNGFDLTIREHKLKEPLLLKKTSVIFVNSMSDCFHEGISDDYLDKMFDVMRKADWHVFQVLTKRPNRMREYFASRSVPKNVWLGVSVENQRHVDRIDVLREIKASCRFLSCEPLLSSLEMNLEGIHWVIVGGESGRTPRPIKVEWVEDIQRQCEIAGVDFFFKQWGGRNKKEAGRLLNGREWNAVPNIKDFIVEYRA